MKGLMYRALPVSLNRYRWEEKREEISKEIFEMAESAYNQASALFIRAASLPVNVIVTQFFENENVKRYTGFGAVNVFKATLEMTFEKNSDGYVMIIKKLEWIEDEKAD